MRQAVAIQASLKHLDDVGLFRKIRKHGSGFLFRRFLIEGFDGQWNAGQSLTVD
jgi:hypothetical protein